MCVTWTVTCICSVRFLLIKYSIENCFLTIVHLLNKLIHMLYMISIFFPFFLFQFVNLSSARLLLTNTHDNYRCSIPLYSYTHALVQIAICHFDFDFISAFISQCWRKIIFHFKVKLMPCKRWKKNKNSNMYKSTNVTCLSLDWYQKTEETASTNRNIWYASYIIVFFSFTFFSCCTMSTAVIYENK